VKRARIDEIDRTIIRELARNARSTYKEIAEVVKLTDVAVMKRVKKLEKLGVIKKYTVIIDPKALGYEYVSFTGINVKPEKLFHVAEELKGRDYIKYLALTGGDHDILAVIWATTREELEHIHREIERLDGVVAVYPMILATTIKDEFYV
jgi:Lrp/AsnC family transcriptional regulator for asnA, asnC and gidA